MSDSAPKSYVRDIAHAVVVPASRVVRSAEVAHVGGRPAVPKATTKIELVKENGVVRAIDVICECGQTIRLWCSYEENSEGRQQS